MELLYKFNQRKTKFVAHILRGYYNYMQCDTQSSTGFNKKTCVIVTTQAQLRDA